MRVDMSELPAGFTADGVLPPGDYEMTLEELRASMLVTGTGASSTWDAAWRRKLVDNLAVMAEQLWSVGIAAIYVDGSFVEDKDHPNDIDGYFECALSDLTSGDLTARLNLIDPHKVWTWDHRQRRAYPGSPKKQLPMWLVYRVELYPHFGQLTGIHDKWGNELEFPSAFRQSRRDSRPKGIVKLIRRTP
jgi:hypothetical protein